MNKLVAITIGDIKGVGIDILIKTWKENKIKNFILITNIEIFKECLIKRKISIKLNLINKDDKNFNFENNRINIFSYNVKSVEDNTYKSLKHAYDLCIKKNV